jgi:hypothetical protein
MFDHLTNWKSLLAEVSVDPATFEVSLPSEIEEAIENMLQADPDVMRRRSELT